MKKVIAIIICLAFAGSAYADETQEPQTSMDELRTLIQPEDNSKSDDPTPLIDVLGPQGSERMLTVPRPPEGQVVWQ